MRGIPLLSKLFWLQSLDRAVRTFAQTLVAVLGANGVGLLDAPWPAALSAAGMAAVLSVLTSVAASNAGTPGTPDLLKAPAPKD
ncbi:holin [Kutzneria chonburiensis]|uniref:Holin n=1 Tax=Kutzneria chonburiensis TaxID=1483604 RepID=A0ABV6N3K3_9PSEU